MNKRFMVVVDYYGDEIVHWFETEKDYLYFINMEDQSEILFRAKKKDLCGGVWIGIEE